MTTLYKPVLIETAEQADQLPEGAFIIDALDLVARLEKTGRYAGRWLTEEDGCLDDPVMPAQAFVPIEAEEETRQRDACPIRSMNDPRWKNPFDDHEGDQWVEESRLVTPWEEA